jgi:hypothetical protein
LVFSLNTFFTFFKKNPELDMNLSITNHTAKSLSWSGPKRKLAKLCNYPEVKKDGCYVSDIRYSDIWHTCSSPAYCPEQVVG